MRPRITHTCTSPLDCRKGKPCPAERARLFAVSIRKPLR
jgi:hypothetical protein